MSKVISINVRLATAEDAHLDTYDNTKLQAFNTCPTWGVVRYQMHKAYATNSRAMALEAGGALHEVFAAVRLYQLVYHTLRDNPLSSQFLEVHGLRCFGEERWELMKPNLDSDEDDRTKLINFALSALYTCGFYDDPSDRRRTMSNLEEAALLYIDRYDMERMPVWVRDTSDPNSDVGIEIAFDVVIEYQFDTHARHYRFTGKFDGLHWRDGELVLGENKTGARLDEAWRQSFELSSQVTGYCLAASVWAGHSCNRAVVYGLQIPLPKTYDVGGNIQEHARREPHHFARWFDWFLYTVDGYERFRSDPISAPKFTHSCNRYFRPCSLIPFCASDDEDQRQGLSEMVIQEWSPLHLVQDKASD